MYLTALIELQISTLIWQPKCRDKYGLYGTMHALSYAFPFDRRTGNC